jgi:hypothetical protein
MKLHHQPFRTIYLREGPLASAEICCSHVQSFKRNCFEANSSKDKDYDGVVLHHVRSVIALGIDRRSRSFELEILIFQAIYPRFMSDKIRLREHGGHLRQDWG